jgi:hypothetical protein
MVVVAIKVLTEGPPFKSSGMVASTFRSNTPLSPVQLRKRDLSQWGMTDRLLRIILIGIYVSKYVQVAIRVSININRDNSVRLILFLSQSISH